MSDSIVDLIVILIITIIPISLILLQLFLSNRKKLLWGFVIPIIWSLIGVLWVVKSGFKDDKLYIFKLSMLFVAGDMLLAGILVLIRKRKKIKNTS